MKIESFARHKKKEKLMIRSVHLDANISQKKTTIIGELLEEPSLQSSIYLCV